MDVLICEDNIEQLYNLKQIVEEFQAENNVQLNILIASTKAEDIIEIIKNRQYKPGALFILDIFLDKSQFDGFEVAKLVRKNDRISSIVFSTTHSEMTYMTFLYKVEALDYVLKDEVKIYVRRIKECLAAALTKNRIDGKRIDSKEEYFSVKVGAKRIRIYEYDFVYAETSQNKHRIIIHTLNQQLEIYGSLNEFINNSSKIVRCHNSYVINKNQVKMLDLNEMKVILNTGQTCYFSRKYINDLKDILSN